MPRMSATSNQSARLPLPGGVPFCTALLCTGLLCAAAGCETTTTVPPDSHLGGDWKLDRAASDDPDDAINKAMNLAESKLRHRLARYGYGPDQGPGQPGSDSSPDAPDYSFDTPGDRYGGPGLVGPDFRGLKVRLRQALIPPRSLHLELEDDEVAIGEDRLPARDYHVGERLSRLDEYGTAIITPSFSHEQFILKSNYTHARRIDTYEVNPASGTLTFTEQISDPTVGRILVHSVYRRG
jgi:hypothetical protein